MAKYINITGTITKDKKSAKESNWIPNCVDRLYFLAILPSIISKAPPNHAKSAAAKNSPCVI